MRKHVRIRKSMVAGNLQIGDMFRHPETGDTCLIYSQGGMLWWAYWEAYVLGLNLKPGIVSLPTADTVESVPAVQPDEDEDDTLATVGVAMAASSMSFPQTELQLLPDPVTEPMPDPVSDPAPDPTPVLLEDPDPVPMADFSNDSMDTSASSDDAGCSSGGDSSSCDDAA